MCAESGVPGVTTSGIALFAFACIVVVHFSLVYLRLRTRLASLLWVSLEVTVRESISQLRHVWLTPPPPQASSSSTSSPQACSPSPPPSTSSSCHLLLSLDFDFCSCKCRWRHATPATTTTTLIDAPWSQLCTIQRNVVNVIAVQWELTNEQAAAIKYMLY